MMSNARRDRLAPPAGLLLAALALALSACSGTGDVLPEKLGGLPAGAPQAPATALPSANVYEVRPTREARPLNDDEQKKLESELTTLRESQKQRANPPPPAPPPPPPKKAAVADKKTATPARKPASPEKKKAAADPAAKPSAAPMKLN
jgi:outer membrane biosynthesis protein TonB